MHPLLRCGLAALLALPASLPASAAHGPAQDTRGPLRFGDPEEYEYWAPFFPGARYDPGVPPVEALTGRPAGDRLAHHDELVACFEAWAAASPRVVLRDHGRTHEGRPLVHAVVTSPANHARLGELLALHARLDDPRGSDAAELDAALADLPAVAWMGYSIHGDEVSGCDAALALGYHLAACTDEEVVTLLDELVVVIDPNLNPDGRERIVGMVEQAAGRAPVLDHTTMHRGRWPYGRGNHYLFDLNRDWMAGTQPETRARWSVARGYHPQLFVDAHEMGPLDTFLFYPQAVPINPFLPPDLVERQRRFAEGAAAAFDALGWSYYTREWADGWAPFYSDAWGSLLGATGMLYEQASAHGQPLRKASGRVEPYRETVHHQVAASWANLRTLQAAREDALRSQLAFARASVDPAAPGNDRAFVFTATGNPARERRFLALLAGQGIEVHTLAEGSELADVRRWDGVRVDRWTPGPGTYVVPAAQPRAAMVKAYLSFDVRMDADALQREREALERTGASRIYDVTSWSLPLTHGLDAAWVDAPSADRLERLRTTSGPATRLAPTPADTTPVGWVVDGRDDASVPFAAAALEDGLLVQLVSEPFRLGTRTLARGSLLVPVSENLRTRPDASLEPSVRAERVQALRARVLELARASDVATVHEAPTGLADPRDPETGAVDPDAPDLGGGHVHLLARPRVALLANAPVEPDVFGHLWWWLDHELGVGATQLDVAQIDAYDLRRYDVVVAPPGGLTDATKTALEGWVEGGGTLVAVGEAAARATSGELGMSDVTLRRHALEELDAIAAHVEREVAARDVRVDPAVVWGDAPLVPADEEADAPEDEGAEAEPPTEDEEAWARRFAPFGVTVRAWADPEHWLCAGVSAEDAAEVPVHVDGDHVLLSRPGVETPVRLVEAERLRLSGLLWPEARERLARSAWATVERKGDGQVILFADVPGFRGYQALTARLFANAVVYGPGLGTSRPVPR